MNNKSGANNIAEAKRRLPLPQLRAGHRSHEWHSTPQFPVAPLSPVSPDSPVSGGQARQEKALKALAARNVCTEPNSARERLWQLVRDLRGLEKGVGRELDTVELMIAFNEWHRLSQSVLDPAKTRDDYLTEFFAGFRKVRVPTGEGETNRKALDAVLKLPASKLPMIPGIPDAPESLRRVAALHREMSRRVGSNPYFLSCRDTAKAVPGMSHQAAGESNRALDRLRVIKIVRVGDAHPNGKASEFRYLLQHSENRAEEDEGGLEL